MKSIREQVLELARLGRPLPEIVEKLREVASASHIRHIVKTWERKQMRVALKASDVTTA